MTDAEFTSYTIIEFPSEAEMEFFLSERISKSASLRDSMKKSGMSKCKQGMNNGIGDEV